MLLVRSARDKTTARGESDKLTSDRGNNTKCKAVDLASPRGYTYYRRSQDFAGRCAI